MRSLIGNTRMIVRSVFQTPGPRTLLRPDVPKRGWLAGVLTDVKEDGAYQYPVVPTPPWNCSGATWSAVCQLFGAFSEVVGAITVNGRPVYIASTPLNCQPPT